MYIWTKFERTHKDSTALHSFHVYNRWKKSCWNMSGHALMGRPAARLETMVLVFSSYVLVCVIRLVPAQDGPFFYTRSHLSALQNCAVLLSTNFQIIVIFKECTTQFSHWIVQCAIFFKNIVQLFIKFTRSFVAIELLTCFINAKNYFIAWESSHYFG